MESLIKSETIDQFQKWLEDRGRSANTVRAYVSDLNIFLTEHGGTVPSSTASLDAMRWLNKYRETLKPRTTARRLTAVKTLIRFLRLPSEDLYDYNLPTPAKLIAHPIPERREGVFKMLANCRNDEQRSLVILTGFCGLRCAEALEVIPVNFTADGTLTIRGKGDRERVVYIADFAWALLQPIVIKAMVSQHPRLITYSDRGARKCITVLGKKAQLSRPIASHDMRMTFGTGLNERTKDLRVVQEALGHANSKSTEGYTEVTPDRMREAVNA